MEAIVGGIENVRAINRYQQNSIGLPFEEQVLVFVVFHKFPRSTRKLRQIYFVAHRGTARGKGNQRTAAELKERFVSVEAQQQPASRTVHFQVHHPMLTGSQ